MLPTAPEPKRKDGLGTEATLISLLMEMGYFKTLYISWEVWRYFNILGKPSTGQDLLSLN